MMSDREIQAFLDGRGSTAPGAADKEALAAYQLVYRALGRQPAQGLADGFAERVAGRLSLQPATSVQRESALEWVLPLLSLMPVIIFAFFQIVPLWLEHAAEALQRSGEAGSVANMLSVCAVLLLGFLLIGMLDSLLRRGRWSRSLA